MSLRKIQTVAGVDKVAKVYRDSEFDEYRVTFFLNGQKINGADYHTGDKQDAIDTAHNWVK